MKIKMFIIIWKTLFIITIIYPNYIFGYFNLFINQKEVMKLMGIEAELFYVREGAINTYAMLFVVPVPATVDDLEFSWQSLTKHPLPYTISIDYDANYGGLQPPEINIPLKGNMSEHIETFTIQLPCVGNVSEEVLIAINIQVQAPPKRNDTKLVIKRKKICLKGVTPSRNRAPEPAQAPSQGPALLGAAACAFGLVIIVGFITSAMYVRARKQIRQDSLHTSYTTAAYGSHQNVFIRLDPLGRPPSVNSGSYATIASLNKFPLVETTKKNSNWFRQTPSPSPYATTLLPVNHNNNNDSTFGKAESICPSRVSYYASSQLTQVYSLSTPRSFHTNTSDPKDKLRRVAVPQGTIQCHKLLDEGTYGRLYSGTLHRAVSDQREILVKTVIDGAALSQVAYLLSEGAMLCCVAHPNVLAPIAAYTELPGLPLIAYTKPGKGNLKHYLHSCRDTGVPLSTRQLVEFGLQVARGVSHLHSLGILHRDIATRNCVIESDARVRICDTALTRDLFPNDYYCLGDNENRPVKWMALESLQNKLYSIASDIWSLGVLLWELSTLGSMPFEEVDPFELAAYLRDGYRLGQPVNCPDEFYTVMSCCWLADHKQRPAFPQLIAFMHDFHEDLGKYI